MEASQNNNVDGGIFIDTGAGRGLKRTMNGLTNPTPANVQVTWGDGSSTHVTTKASLPEEYELPPFLVSDKVHSTLVSVGSNTENTTECYSFFDKHTFRLKGLQIYLNDAGELAARFVGSGKDRVKYIVTKPRPGGVYIADSLDVFKKNDSGAGRFQHHAKGTVIAGPSTTRSNAYTAQVVDAVFAGHSATQRDLITKTPTRTRSEKQLDKASAHLKLDSLEVHTESLEHTSTSEHPSGTVPSRTSTRSKDSGQSK